MNIRTLYISLGPSVLAGQGLTACSSDDNATEIIGDEVSGDDISCLSADSLSADNFSTEDRNFNKKQDRHLCTIVSSHGSGCCYLAAA